MKQKLKLLAALPAVGGIALISQSAFAAGIGADAAAAISGNNADLTTVAVAVIGLVAVACVAGVIMGLLKKG